MKVFNSILCILFLNGAAIAQLFSPDSAKSSFFNQFKIETAQWGDLDQDGFLDVCFTGQDSNSTIVTKLFKNNGDGTFTDLHSNIVAVSSAAIALGDFDNDNDLDLFITGNDTSNQKIARLYQNSGNGLFSDTGFLFQGVSAGDARFTDIDADGDLDLLYCGADVQNTAITKLYINQNGADFTETATTLSGSVYGTIAVSDFNNDGQPDILLTGRNENNLRFATIYRNNTNLTFSALQTGIPAMDSSAADWGDYDNDGDADLIISGVSDSGLVTQIYRNDGNDTFTKINASLPGLASGSAVWGDMDNDGVLDLLISGEQDTSGLTALFLNSGNDTFTRTPQAFDTIASNVTIADIENDSDLDIFLNKVQRDSLNNVIFTNTILTPNTIPASPANLTSQLTATAIELRWDAATDAETPAAGLTYNLRIGTTPGGSEIKSAMAITSGKRSLLRVGNAGANRTWSLSRNLFHHTESIYWSVQAIDHGFAASPFSTEATFTQPFFEDTLAANALSGINAGDVDWGDFDNDDDLDLFISGQDIANQRIAILYENLGNGQFKAANTSFLGVAASSSAWGDVNNDGYSDLLVTGFDAQNQVTARLYKNNTNGTFTDMNAALNGVAGGAVLWADFNNDGLQDILISGLDSQNIASTKIYENQNGGDFIERTVNLPGVILSSVDAADFDNDGDQDVLISGLNVNGRPVTQIFRNDGQFLFTSINAPLPGISSGSSQWGDFNNDGFDDILVSGLADTGRISTVFKNNGDASFTDIHAALMPVSNGNAAWGDFDNDGDLDILLTGQDADIQRISTVYQNDNGVFTKIQTWLDGVIFSSVAWADYDNDRDLDILLTGSDKTTRVAKLYRNNTPGQNEAPSAPTGLTAQLTPASIVFNWQNATDKETPSNALTYNIRIGTKPGSGDLVSPLANQTGFRQIISSGNVGSNTSYEFSINDILNFPSVFWTVQAVDQQFAGSAFSEETSLGPIITSIRDVPNDQGGKVSIVWKASALDINLNDLTHYSIWRTIPTGNQTEKSKPGVNFDASTKHPTRTVQLNGRTFNWEWLADQPAHRRDTYSYTAETLFDSISTTAGTHFYLVSAHTGDVNVFFDSLPDSGHSVDNLPPLPPQIIAGNLHENGLSLSWQKNPEPDIDQYLVYLSQVSQFNPADLEPITTTKDTSVFLQNLPESGQIFLKVVAEDKNENLSPASDEFAFVVTSVAGANTTTPTVFSLQQNFPNPFNPATQIRFDIPKAATVRLDIFNLRGEVVRTLVKERKPAGSYVVTFDASQLSSGMYFYKISAGDFVAVKKMTLLK